jgi:hypothetical protein
MCTVGYCTSMKIKKYDIFYMYLLVCLHYPGTCAVCMYLFLHVAIYIFLKTFYIRIYTCTCSVLYCTQFFLKNTLGAGGGLLELCVFFGRLVCAPAGGGGGDLFFLVS